MIFPQQQTFDVDIPLATHWRRVSCKEHGCLDRDNGFAVLLSEVHQADLVSLVRLGQHGRHYEEESLPDQMVKFWFPPGQDCFKKHLARIDRPEVMTWQTGTKEIAQVQSGTIRRFHAETVRDFDSHENFIEAMQEQFDRVERSRR